MTVHLLNCGSMNPYFPPVKNGITCLLAETNLGLVLVDTGFGLNDIQHPRLAMRFYLTMMRSPRDVNETAYYHLKRLGYNPNDMRHIIMTHLHFDHAGGLADFPKAKIHLSQPELDHITRGRLGWEYDRSHFEHGPVWTPHQLTGESWFGFDAIRLEVFTPEIWLVPLTGHSPGHAGVAIATGSGWILHAGDAIPFNADFDNVPDRISRLMLGPHIPKIREFTKNHPEIMTVGSHMAPEFYQDHLKF
ncbi:MAG: MBL fold metallo-hydrolase [Anaerolineales bacterium]|jgi:glyoxylase-like metal-dependent hydrolase (beta-lactamase superfamily II)